MPKVASTPGRFTEVVILRVSPAYVRLLTELARQTSHLSRSRVIREAVVEKADRELAPDWRERIDFTESGEAA